MLKKLSLLIIGTITLYALHAFCGDSASLSSVDTPGESGLKLDYTTGTTAYKLK